MLRKLQLPGSTTTLWSNGASPPPIPQIADLNGEIKYGLISNETSTGEERDIGTSRRPSVNPSLTALRPAHTILHSSVRRFGPVGPPREPCPGSRHSVLPIEPWREWCARHAF